MLINSYLTFCFLLFPMTTSLQLGSLNMNGNIGNESYFELRIKIREWKWSSQMNKQPKWLKKNLKIQSAWPEIEPWFFATSRQNALRMSTKFNIRSASYSDSTHWCSLVPRPVRAIWVTRAGEFSRQTWQVTSHPKSPRTTGNEAAVGENDLKWLIFWTADKDMKIGLIRFHG